MKLVATAVTAWTVAILLVALFVGGAVNTPGCAHRIGPLSADCQAAMAAGNDAVFWGQTVPFAIFVLGGTVVVVAAAVTLWRRSRSAGDA